MGRIGKSPKCVIDIIGLDLFSLGELGRRANSVIWKNYTKLSIFNL